MLYLHNILGGVWFVEENFAANYFPLIASFLTKPETMFGKPRNASSEQEPTEDNALLFASLKWRIPDQRVWRMVSTRGRTQKLRSHNEHQRGDHEIRPRMRSIRNAYQGESPKPMLQRE